MVTDNGGEHFLKDGVYKVHREWSSGIVTMFDENESLFDVKPQQFKDNFTETTQRIFDEYQCRRASFAQFKW